MLLLFAEKLVRFISNAGNPFNRSEAKKFKPEVKRLGLFYLRYAAHRTHYLGPFSRRADIALPSHCQLVAGFFYFRLTGINHYVLC